uniref:Uncharacterized protein TCIL3000_2_1530 n=1 Tax=Trypanosoma congolense (strain IL3000) TaxID=1068625 RepID=G0UJM2_TRYCI|nr:unnamed protein product [Trypanosoma congolense IL3000]
MVALRTGDGRAVGPDGTRDVHTPKLNDGGSTSAVPHAGQRETDKRDQGGIWTLMHPPLCTASPTPSPPPFSRPRASTEVKQHRRTKHGGPVSWHQRERHFSDLESPMRDSTTLWKKSDKIREDATVESTDSLSASTSLSTPVSPSVTTVMLRSSHDEEVCGRTAERHGMKKMPHSMLLDGEVWRQIFMSDSLELQTAFAADVTNVLGLPFSTTTELTPTSSGILAHCIILYPESLSSAELYDRLARNKFPAMRRLYQEAKRERMAGGSYQVYTTNNKKRMADPKQHVGKLDQPTKNDSNESECAFPQAGLYYKTESNAIEIEEKPCDHVNHRDQRANIMKYKEQPMSRASAASPTPLEAGVRGRQYSFQKGEDATCVRCAEHSMSQASTTPCEDLRPSAYRNEQRIFQETNPIEYNPPRGLESEPMPKSTTRYNSNAQYSEDTLMTAAPTSQAPISATRTNSTEVHAAKHEDDAHHNAISQGQQEIECKVIAERPLSYVSMTSGECEACLSRSQVSASPAVGPSLVQRGVERPMSGASMTTSGSGVCAHCLKDFNFSFTTAASTWFRGPAVCLG